MQFEFTPSSQGLINSVISITSCMGYRAQDLRIIAKKGETIGDVVPNSRFNGVLRFEFGGYQSFAEFEINAVIEAEGSLVTNSYFLNQLPAIPEGELWKCNFDGRAHLIVQSSGGDFRFDFNCGDAAHFEYDPKYCEPNINLGPITSKLNNLSRTIAGFVNRKSGSDLSEVGCVKICGTPNPDGSGAGLITFEATNMQDAIYGEEPVDTMPNPWQVLIPIALFGSWNNLPLDQYPMTLGIGTDYQVTLRCGPITIQHNTLSNLINRMEDVAGFANYYKILGDSSAPEHSELLFEMNFAPSEVLYRVQNATIYADGDPSLHVTNESETGLNIEVRAVTTDSKVKVRAGVKVVKDGEFRLSKGSLALVSRIQDLCNDKPELSTPQHWLNVRANNAFIMVCSPDKRWLAVAAQTTI